MTQVLVVGSVALDTIETPFGRRDSILGGSAVHFSLAASSFAAVRLVGVAGKDFPKAHVDMLRAHKVDTAGLELAEGETFRWHGRFEGDMSRAQTISVALNVFGSFRPRIPQAFTSTPYVLLGNGSPHTQKAVLDQLKSPKFVILDTMDLWISNERAALLDLLPRVNALCANLDEVKQLSGTQNGAAAIRKLFDFGVRAAIVKRGEHGATLATKDFFFSVPAYPTQRVTDPTGAGDSFAGGVLGFLASQSASAEFLRKALIYGTVMGSFAVEEFGTERLQRITRPEIDARAAELTKMITP